MEKKPLWKGVLVPSIMSVILALALFGLVTFPISIGSAEPPPQLSQITSCVEVPSSLVDASRKRASTRSDCDPQIAFARAQQQSRVNARNALDSICEDQISAAEASDICDGASGEIPSTTGTSPTGDPIPRPGGSSVDAQLPIAQANPKLCVVLRDLPAETVTTTRAAGIENGFCVFNNNTLTTTTVRARARCGVQCLNLFHHQLRVSRFTTSLLSGGAADGILADATAILKTDDGAGDVSCRTTLSRLGSVTTFAEGDGSVDSRAELITLLALPGNVMIVNDINFCSELQPNAIGCAPLFHDTQIAVRFTANQEGILWAHEFGHNKGLDHRNNVTAIMNDTIGVNRRGVSSGECLNYRTLAGKPWSAQDLALFQPDNAHALYYQRSVAAFDADETQRPDSRRLDIAQFVRQTFIHGVPYEEASKYPLEVVPRLLEMLNDRGEEPYWPNIVVTLGMIGDGAALDQMIAFIHRDRGRISAPHYRAKTALIMSLGYLINKTGSRKALDYLTSGLDPRVWPARVGANLAPFQTSTIERDHDFARHAVLGLALSGHAEAERALRALQQRAGSPVEQKFRREVGELIAETLKEHEQIARGGLADYYRSR